MAQVQIRLVGQTRQAVEAALAQLQSVGVQVQRGPRLGRNNEWLAYASVSLETDGSPLGNTPSKGDTLR